MTLPLVIEPTGDPNPSALVERISAKRKDLESSLRTNGAILFRGFDISRAEAFEEIALALDPHLQTEYLGTSPRAGITRHVFSASELPGYYPIPQHCEMTFVREPPRRLFFACLVPTRGKGGETPLVDFRKVYAELDPAVRDRFIAGGIRIIRNYDGPNTKRRFDLWKLKRWDEMFGTADRAVVEAKCRAEDFDVGWLEDDRLRLVSTQPAVRNHPETGEPAWFNHVQVFHLASAPAEYRRIFARRRDPKMLALWLFSRVLVETRRRLVRPEDQSLHCTYADGREISDSDLEHVRDTIWKNMVVFTWQRGDVVAIDNRSVAHGRLPYRGDERRIVVAWA